MRALARIFVGGGQIPLDARELVNLARPLHRRRLRSQQSGIDDAEDQRLGRLVTQRHRWLVRRPELTRAIEALQRRSRHAEPIADLEHALLHPFAIDGDAVLGIEVGDVEPVVAVLHDAVIAGDVFEAGEMDLAVRRTTDRSASPMVNERPASASSATLSPKIIVGLAYYALRIAGYGLGTLAPSP